MQFHRFVGSLFLDTDFKNSTEFKRKYTAVSLQRAKIFKWVTFAINGYSLYLDVLLHRAGTVDALYRQNLLAVHIAGLVLSLAYILVYVMIERSDQCRFSRVAKATIISDLFLTLSVAAFLSLNSHRYIANNDSYITVVLVTALVIPMYPKWVLGIYGVVHISFLIALSWFCKNDTIPIELFNSTTTVLIAIVLFLTLYRYNVKNFLSEEMLKEDKSTFIKLFEISPFPLVISRFGDGKIQYINQRALQFYGAQKEQLEALHHRDFYKNASDLDVICKTLEVAGRVNNYEVEQKTVQGQTKHAIVSYELINYFGENSILSGVADIAEIRRMEKELTIYASTDMLTGVLNRRVGMDLLRKRFEAAKNKKEEFNLGFFDIDHLKMVNDTFGHLEGDSLIIDICKIIREEIENDDIMFRYGGDEFMVLFHNGQEQVSEACSRIAERFEILNKNHYRPYPVNASMGVFSYKPEMDLSLEQMIETVDRNMYQNKSKGNKFV